MSEKEMKETAEEKSCNCGCQDKCFCKRLLSLKGLSKIYKVLAALLMAYLLYILVMVWFMVFKNGADKMEALLGSVQFILTYGFYALVMLTVAKVLRVLRKIKKAVVTDCK